jgi:hypothetical protein
MIEEIKKIIELSPARQAQVCYNATLKKDTGKLIVTFKPTLDFFDLRRTGDRDMIGLYSSMVFHAGLTVGSIEHWCQENQKRYELNVDIPREQESTVSPNFYDLMLFNKDFIIDETVAYLDFLNTRSQLAPGGVYEYDSNKCRRDLTFLLDAFVFDIKHDTNQRSCQIMNEFWCNGRRQVRGVAEKVAYQYLKELINNFIILNKPATVYQTNVNSEQKFIDRTIESAGVEKFNFLLDIFSKVVEDGVQHIPEVYNSFPRNNDKIEVTIYE